MPDLRAATALSGIDLLTTVDGLMVGDMGHKALIERWNGTRLKVQDVPPPATGRLDSLNDVSALSGSSAFAVGRSLNKVTKGSVGIALEWNGSIWASTDVASLGSSSLEQWRRLA